MQILNDFSTSVWKAFDEIDPNWPTYRGLVVCGTHSPHDIEKMIEEIKKARETNTPFLGICFGFQLAAIEYARNVMGYEFATSQEFEKRTINDLHVVYKLPKMRVGLIDGESYWHQYAINISYLSGWEIKMARDMMIPIEARLTGHEFFVGTQGHPEYQNSIDKPHPLLVEFLTTCKKHAE